MKSVKREMTGDCGEARDETRLGTDSGCRDEHAGETRFELRF
jgi:hypothetical protein